MNTLIIKLKKVKAAYLAQKTKKPGIAKRFRVQINFGGVLLSHTAARAVPSAQKGLRAQARNISTTLLVFVPVCGVTSTGTYPDMHRRMCLADEPKSGAIWWKYFLPAP
jgi:hypothetical protein